MVRPASTSDDATPNPNAIAAQNLVRLAALTGDHQWRERPTGCSKGVLGGAGENLLSHAALLNAIDLRLNAAEIVAHRPGSRALCAGGAAAAVSQPHRAAGAGGRGAAAHHPAQAKIAAGPASAAFICVGETCSLPVTDPDKIADAVAAMRPARSA